MNTKDTTAVENIEGKNLMSRRKPWLIVLLSLVLCSYVFVYCGRLRRAIAWLLAVWLCITPIAACSMLYFPSGKSGYLIGCLCILLGYIAIIIDALMIARKKSDEPYQSYQKWWCYLLIALMFMVVTTINQEVIRGYWCEAFFIPTNSMQPTLLAGDRILVDKLAFSRKKLSRGEIVLFKPPREGMRQYNQSTDLPTYVKRILAVGGDTIEIVDDKVFVNEKPISENYTQFDLPDNLTNMQRNTSLTTVPEGHVFVLGDNRWQSLDSRFFGTVPIDNLIGEVRLIFWSREYELIPSIKNRVPEEIQGELRWERMGMIAD